MGQGDGWIKDVYGEMGGVYGDGGIQRHVHGDAEADRHLYMGWWPGAGGCQSYKQLETGSHNGKYWVNFSTSSACTT